MFRTNNVKMLKSSQSKSPSLRSFVRGISSDFATVSSSQTVQLQKCKLSHKDENQQRKSNSRKPFFLMEQHFKILKPVTFNIKNLASLCLTADEVVQTAGKRANVVQLMESFRSGNRLQPFWISHNKRKPIPSSHPSTSY